MSPPAGVLSIEGLLTLINLFFSHLVGSQLVAEHSLALVSPKIDQNFHRAHVDFALYSPRAAPFRNGRLGREQYALQGFTGLEVFAGRKDKEDKSRTTRSGTFERFLLLRLANIPCRYEFMDILCGGLLNQRDPWHRPMLFFSVRRLSRMGLVSHTHTRYLVPGISFSVGDTTLGKFIIVRY